MTFEEWLLEQGFKHPEFGLMVKRSEFALMQTAWNAALTSGIKLLEDGDYYWPSANPTGPDRQPNRAPHAENELRKLLTA